MAKRFTDSGKWNKPFIRGMKAPYKLLWLYILDECDHAGIWQVDIQVAELKIGEKLKLETAIKFFESKISVIDGGEKWFINDFIEFQYGQLNSQNRAHNSVIQILKKFNLIDISTNVIKPLTSPLQGAMDMDKDKDKVKDMDKDKDKDTPKIEKSELEKTFDSFLEMRRKIKKPATDRAVELLKSKLKKLSNGNENTAIEIIEQSIMNSWQDFYPLKNSKNDTNNKPLGRGTVQQAFDLLESARKGKSIEELRDTPGLL